MDLYSEMANIAKIIDGLFIGDATAGTTLDMIFEFKISHMINTASNQIPSQFSSIGVKYLNLNWPENPLSNIPIIKEEIATKIVNFIDNCLKNSDGLMIYSLKGQNRCCVVVIVYLMRKYFWSLEKCKAYLLSKKQDMKITRNFLEQLHNYEIHLHKLYPNRKKSINWDEDIKDNDELLMRNTYINEVELSKKKNFLTIDDKKSNKRHVGWADDVTIKSNSTNGVERNFINYNIENDLYFKKNVKDITSHLDHSKELKSIIKVTNNLEPKIKIISEFKVDSSLEDNNKEEKMEFYDTKNILQSKSINIKDEIKKEENNKNSIKNKDHLKENNLNIGNKESLNDIKMSNDYSKNNNSKMKLNIFKNLNKKEKMNNNLMGNSNDIFPINLSLKEYNKIGQENNINFNNINMQDFNKKYYNNFISNDNINNKNLKNNNNIYPIYIQPNKTQKKSRSTSKTSHNNNMIPFIEYNQNNNIITNIMINHNPQLANNNNNQKLFLKFNKDNNLINNNNNNQFIQNNNFININYYPQNNESKYIYLYNNIYIFNFRYYSWNK